MRKRMFIIYIACIIVLLAGCGRSDNQVTVSTSTNDSTIYIYYPEGKEVKRDSEKYQIKLPDSVSSSVEEVMTVLVEKLDASFLYHTYMLDADNNLTLEFTAKDKPADETSLLTDAALCETLFQIEEINSISIILSDDAEGTIRDNLYMRESFLFYGYDDSEMNNRQITVYYADKSGDRLVSSDVTLVDEPNTSMEEKIVDLLVSRGSLPANVEVNSVGISGEICYLDLSSEFMNSVSGVSGEAALYSLVNSIVSLDGIEALQIMVDGSVIHMYRGVSGVEEPLSFNSEVL